jgi:hypothetical protein
MILTCTDQSGISRLVMALRSDRFRRFEIEELVNQVRCRVRTNSPSKWPCRRLFFWHGVILCLIP